MSSMKFEIEADEAAKVLAWISGHPCKVRGKYQGAIGGAITYSFTDTSIGQIQTVECACGGKHTVDTHL